MLPDTAGYRNRVKSRSGCLTCKRIKCDENRPNCQRCSSTGRKCDGYRTPSPPAKYYAQLSMPAFSPPGLDSSEHEREIRSFQYFYERTVPALAGYCGSEFWNRLVLQVSQHEKSVWHALIALGSLHENFEKEQELPWIEFIRREQNSFAIREYLSAIQALLRPTAITPSYFMHLTVDVCLISCILFTCLEILSGHYGPAINHVRSGMRILGEVYYDPNSGTFRHPHLQPSTVTKLEMENIRKIFTRLQGQSLTLTRADMDHPAHDHGEIPTIPHLSIEVPESFASIAEARDYFENIHRICLHHYPRIMSSTTAAEAPNMSAYLMQQYGAVFHSWCTAFARFEESRGEVLTTKQRMGLILLHIQKNNTMMYYEYARSSEAALFSSETKSFSWDDHNNEFAEIVSLAESVIKTSYDTNRFNPLNEGTRPAFSLDNGVIGPLYNVATLCRDPIIRRRALGALRAARRQEGFFNSDLCAIVAEKIIAIEENAAQKAILDYHSDFLSLESIISDTKLEKPASEITTSSEIPNTVRLTYAYPKFDIVKKQMFLTIGQSMKGDIDVPWPAMSFLVDVPN